MYQWQNTAILFKHIMPEMVRSINQLLFVKAIHVYVLLLQGLNRIMSIIDPHADRCSNLNKSHWLVRTPNYVYLKFLFQKNNL